MQKNVLNLPKERGVHIIHEYLWFLNFTVKSTNCISNQDLFVQLQSRKLEIIVT